MSLRYRDSSGNETIVSGLTPGGDIEAGAVAERSGSGSISSTAGAWGQTTVVFTDPMPDADYIVNIEVISQTSGAIETPVTVSAKTKNGFIASVYGGTTAVTLQFHYTAWKTYSIQHAAQNAEDIANIKAAIPSTASSTNQLTPKRYVDDADTALDGRVSDLEDLIPTGAAVTNQLTTKSYVDDAIEQVEIDIDSTLDSTSENPVQNKVVKAALQEKQDQINDIVNVYGAKNLIPFPYQADISGSPLNGIFYTINDDASITFSGTSTSVIWFSLCGRINYIYPYFIKAGKYILSCEGLPTDTSSYLGIFEEGNTSPLIRADYNSPSTVWDLQTDKMIFIGFRIPNGYTINTTIKPMLRLASIEDDTFEKYQPTNADLRLAIKDNSVAESLTGAKNLNSFPYNSGTTTINGVTFTVNDDGTVTADGTASATAVFSCHSRIKGTVNSLVLPNGTYVLNGCPTGGGSDKYRVLVSRTYNGNSENLASDWYNHGDYGTEFTLAGDDYSQNEVVLGVFIHVATGATVNNVVFKPMIRAKGNTDPIWRPYVLTNTQLTNGLTQAYKNNGITGAKNLIVYPYEVSSYTSRGVDFSANSDGSVNFSGTGNDGNPALMQLYLRFPLKAGTYTISGGDNPYGGISLYFFDQVSGSASYSGEYEGLIKNSSNQVYIWTTAAGSGFSTTSLYGYEKTFTIKSDCYVNIQARSVTNAITSEVSGIIYPMIRLGGDTDSTYQPYAMTNKQITTLFTPLSQIITDTTNVDGTLYAEKYGNILNIRIFYANPAQALATANDYVTIGTLPTEMLPSKYLFKYIVLNAISAYPVISQLGIETNGRIKIGFCKKNGAPYDLTTDDKIYINETFLL